MSPPSHLYGIGLPDKAATSHHECNYSQCCSLSVSSLPLSSLSHLNLLLQYPPIGVGPPLATLIVVSLTTKLLQHRGWLRGGLLAPHSSQEPNLLTHTEGFFHPHSHRTPPSLS